MSTIEKLGMGFIMLAMATTLVLPRRQTPQVIDAAARLFRGSLATAMGTGRDV